MLGDGSIDLTLKSASAAGIVEIVAHPRGHAFAGMTQSGQIFAWGARGWGAYLGAAVTEAGFLQNEGH